MHVYVYGDESTVAVFSRDGGGVFVAADGFAAKGGDRVGQIRLQFTENEAKTFISALQAVLASGGPESEAAA